MSDPQQRRKNLRCLSGIASEIHLLERRNIFDIGTLLIEAKKSCNHGEWTAWFKASEFGFSLNIAERYMSVAALASESARVQNLSVPARILYRLPSIDKAILPRIVTELDKASSKGRLSENQCRQIIDRIAPPDGKAPKPQKGASQVTALPDDLAAAIETIRRYARKGKPIPVGDDDLVAMQLAIDFLTEFLRQESNPAKQAYYRAAASSERRAHLSLVRSDGAPL